ncbi:MAG: hypothetical protein JOZ09_12080 [Pseudonocardiales bacterium]|nr:hypothetical protein [Pseudonocardiales bacterium]
MLIHNTGNAEELSRVLEEHMEGHPVDTRSFEEREDTYRAMTDVELWSVFVARCERLVDTADAAEQELPSETAITWTGRTVTPDVFAEHMREEMVLHRWDMTGDDATSVHSLMQPWMTEHSVHDVGTPLLTRGTTGLDLGPTGRIEVRLRAHDRRHPGRRHRRGQHHQVRPAKGQGHDRTDPTVRALFFWGTVPRRRITLAQPSRPRETGAGISAYKCDCL